MRLIALAALALVAACSDEQREEDEHLSTLPAAESADATTPTAAPPPPPPPMPLSPVETLAGEWRVAGIDGEPLDEPYGLALSADAEEIWWEPRCANLARTYRIEGLAIETGEANPTVPIVPGSPPRPVCAIGLPPRLDEVARVLDLAESVGRTPSNGILISGGEHSLTLFSQ